MTKKSFLPCWLAFLVVISGLFATRQAPDALAMQPQTPLLTGEINPQSQNLEPAFASSAVPNLHFDCLTSADGLSFSMATSILQDQRDYMWFGTRFGLDKFDGNNFSIYLPGPSDDLMGGNYILNLYQDLNGDLWLATDIDLVHWDMKTGEFIRYQPDTTNPKSLTPGRINAFAMDSEGMLMVGTNTGLNRYNPETNTFSRYLVGQPVLSLYVDHSGGIWLGTDEGILYYTAGSLEQPNPTHFQASSSDLDRTASNYVNAIYEDVSGVLWVGTYGAGLMQLDGGRGFFTPYANAGDENSNPETLNTLSNNRVSSILEDNSGRLWIATGDGLNLIDRAANVIYQYHHVPGDPNSLADDAVFDLYQDRSGVVWVATLGGVCKLNETASRFTHYQKGASQSELVAGTQAGNNDILSDNIILSVYQDSYGILWIGTADGGLIRLDRTAGSVKVYIGELFEFSHLGPGEVATIYEDSTGIIWIGTSLGLSRFNRQTNTFETEAAFQWMSIGSIAGDPQGNLWLGTWEGLFFRKAGTAAFVPVPLSTGQQIIRRIQQLKVDHTGALWIATQADGLFRLDRAAEGGTKSNLVHFPQNSNDPGSPGKSPVMYIYEDPDGNLWLGSIDDGLIRFDRDTLTFVHFIPEPGAGREVTFFRYISCIQRDAQGYLWMGTVLGLARFDPRYETFSYFDARDGLEIGEGLSCTQSKQGEMFFGSSQGLITFFPDQIQYNPNPPAVVITALNLSNKVLRTDLLPNEYVKLSYKENYLSFDFAALDYTSPAKNQYAYKMVGLESEWNEVGNRRHADYPDLKPGTYTFRVTATNNSGVWNQQGAMVRILIEPPFWQNWWFIGLMVLTFLGIVTTGVWFRLKGVEARRRDLEAQVSSRTSELVNMVAQLTGLQDTTKAVASTLELDSLLKLIVQQATTLLKADGGFINLVDRDKGVDEVFAVTGKAPPVVGERTPLESSLSGWATLHNQAVISNQIPNDDRVARNVRSWVIEEHIQSAAVAPLTIRDQVMGTLLVIGQEEGKGKFTQPDLDLLVAFANQAAIAIENANLYKQSKQLAIVEERSRLARELHDAVTQTLFSASLVAEALPATWERDPREGHGLLLELRGLCRGALAEMRTLLLELRPTAVVETPLGDLLSQLGEAISGREGIPVTVQVEGLTPTIKPSLPPDVHIAVYRITQEALNNVVKHARAHQVAVSLRYSAESQADSIQTSGDKKPGGSGTRVILSIRDDGRGFDPEKIPHNRLGLDIMQERAQAIGAILNIESQPGHGTQITVIWRQEEKQEGI